MSLRAQNSPKINSRLWFLGQVFYFVFTVYLFPYLPRFYLFIWQYVWKMERVLSRTLHSSSAIAFNDDNNCFVWSWKAKSRWNSPLSLYRYKTYCKINKIVSRCRWCEIAENFSFWSILTEPSFVTISFLIQKKKKWLRFS